MTRKESVQKLESWLDHHGVSLRNDARYYDLCRTYGDYSLEVLRHLQSVVDWQRGNHPPQSHH